MSFRDQTLPEYERPPVVRPWFLETLTQLLELEDKTGAAVHTQVLTQRNRPLRCTNVLL